MTLLFGGRWARHIREASAAGTGTGWGTASGATGAHSGRASRRRRRRAPVAAEARLVRCEPALEPLARMERWWWWLLADAAALGH